MLTHQFNDNFRQFGDATLGKKNDLHKADIKLFSQQGPDGTTTAQRAKTTTISKPTIYCHFQNKEDLFAHILLSRFTDYYSRLDKLQNKTEVQVDKDEYLIDFHFIDDFSFTITNFVHSNISELATLNLIR
jgi:AcrR family transcriptional regulator